MSAVSCSVVISYHQKTKGQNNYNATVSVSFAKLFWSLLMKLLFDFRQELETDSTHFWWLRLFKRKKPKRRRNTVSRPKQMSLKEKPTIELIPNTAPRKERPLRPRGASRCFFRSLLSILIVKYYFLQFWKNLW